MSRDGTRQGAGGQKPPTPDKYLKKRRTIRAHDVLWMILKKAAKAARMPLNQYIEEACIDRLMKDGFVVAGSGTPDSYCKECGHEWEHDSDEYERLQFDCPNCGSKKTGQIIGEKRQP